MGAIQVLALGAPTILALPQANSGGFATVIIPFEWLSLSVNMVFAMSWQPFTHGKKLMNLPRY